MTDMDAFERVVCGVDASEAGMVAARLAARVAEPDGELTLLAVDDPSAVIDAAQAMGDLLQEVAAARARPAAAAPGGAHGAQAVETRLVEGPAIDTLLAELERRRATLAVVGSHDRIRAVGIAVGSVTTHVLHEAPCSVLVARKPRSERWPRTIVVGADGSPQSIAAVVVARRLGARLRASVRFVAATRDPHVDLENARRFAPEVEELPGRCVDELHVLSESTDLVVVGSRGLRGIRALGSVSECVAHEARSSVLVVR